MDNFFDFIEKHFAKIGCLVAVCYVIFWAAVIFVVMHFVLKWW